MSYVLQQKHHTYFNYDVNRLANVWVLNSEIMFQIFPFCWLISKNVHGAPISSDEWTAYLNSTSINLMQLIISQITVVMVKITSPIQPTAFFQLFMSLSKRKFNQPSFIQGHEMVGKLNALGPLFGPFGLFSASTHDVQLLHALLQAVPSGH